MVKKKRKKIRGLKVVTTTPKESTWKKVKMLQVSLGAKTGEVIDLVVDKFWELTEGGKNL